MRSGSTILDLCLGSHSSMFSLGEIVNLREAYRAGRQCSCGEKIPNCPFWNAVEKELQARCGRSATLKDWDLTPEDPDLFRYANVEILKAISAVAGKFILVDSSKLRSRLSRYMNIVEIDVKVIHLVRHPIGVATSSKSKGRNGLRSIRGWRNYNEKMSDLMTGHHKEAALITLRHEDFAEDPGKWLREITRRIGVPFQKSQLEYYGTTHHVVGGNRLSLSLHERRPIRLDMRWADRVPLIERIYLRMSAKRSLDRFGYKTLVSKGGQYVLPWQGAEETPYATRPWLNRRETQQIKDGIAY